MNPRKRVSAEKSRAVALGIHDLCGIGGQFQTLSAILVGDHIET